MEEEGKTTLACIMRREAGDERDVIKKSVGKSLLILGHHFLRSMKNGSPDRSDRSSCASLVEHVCPLSQ